MTLLIRNARQVVQVATEGCLFKTGRDMDQLHILEADGPQGISVMVKDGRIAAIGRDSQVASQFPDAQWDHVIDATGRSLIPGFVDAHTHPVWAGDRVHEFSMKLAGASYLEVHKAGGGINFTVEKTREASEQSLLTDFQRRLDVMSRAGTTLVECKSGYGLDLDTELKMLRVIERARAEAPLGISSTYCGAHSVPKGSTAVETAQDIVQRHLPIVKAMNEAGELQVENVDVFCEKGVFDVEATRRILEKSRKEGFLLNFHAEELNYLGGVEMGASLKAEAISHLEEISQAGIESMANAGSVAVLLPTTAFLLRLRQPPARKLIEAGVPVALGSDFNPNAHCLAMPIVMYLACVQMNLSLNEALVASTLNAAHSVRRSHQVGSIEVGKMADILIIDAPRWEHIVYQLGSHEDIITHVIYHGKIIRSK